MGVKRFLLPTAVLFSAIGACSWQPKTHSDCEHLDLPARFCCFGDLYENSENAFARGERLMCETWKAGIISDLDFMLICGPRREELFDELLSTHGIDLESTCAERWDDSDLSTFSGTLELWRTEGCDSEFLSRSVGTCGTGDVVYLSEGTGFEGFVRYYEAETGEFLSVSYSSDYVTPPCCNNFYWPFRFECEDPEITETVCDPFSSP